MIGRAIVPNGSARRASVGFLQCRAIVPNSSARRASVGVLGFFGCFSHRLRCTQAPIDWGQSIYHGSQAGGFCGFFSYKSHRSRMLESGAKKTIIEPVDSSLEIRRGSLESKEIQSVEISGGKP
jgi:hypothetical protein